MRLVTKERGTPVTTRTIRGVYRSNGNTTAAMLVIRPGYTSPELAKAHGRAQALSTRNLAVALTAFETKATAFETKATVAQCVVVRALRTRGGQGKGAVPRAEFEAMIAKIFPDALIRTEWVQSRQGLPPEIAELYGKVFGNN